MTTPVKQSGTSGLYPLLMKGQLTLQIRDLRRMTADATANANAYDGELGDQWAAIRDAAQAELDAAIEAYTDRFTT
jgi:hypothetical protein